jgi:chromosome partitioning protein
MKTFAIANHKGGVCKTTTAIVLAQGLAGLDYKVLVVDTDAQGHVAEYIGMPAADHLFDLIIANRPIAECVTYANSGHNLAVIRSSQKTAAAKVTLAALHTPIDALHTKLQPLRPHIDICIVDTAPSLDALGLGTLYAADYVLVPALCERLALHGVRQVIATIKTVRDTYGAKTQLLGIIPTKFRARTKEHHIHLADLVQVYKALIYPVVPIATAVPEAVSCGIPLWDYDPRGKATKAYRQILQRMLRDTHGQT